MKALILIAVILTFTACFLSAGAHKQKGRKESSSEEFNLFKQRSHRLSKDGGFKKLQDRKNFAKFTQAPEYPRGRDAHSPQGPLHPHHSHPPHFHSPQGSLASSTTPSENVVNSSCQAPPATSGGPTAVSNNAPAVTTAVFSDTIGTTGAPNPTTAPTTLQNEPTFAAAATDTTSAAAADASQATTAAVNSTTV